MTTALDFNIDVKRIITGPKNSRLALFFAITFGQDCLYDLICLGWLLDAHTLCTQNSARNDFFAKNKVF